MPCWRLNSFFSFLSTHLPLSAHREVIESQVRLVPLELRKRRNLRGLSCWIYLGCQGGQKWVTVTLGHSSDTKSSNLHQDLFPRVFYRSETALMVHSRAGNVKACAELNREQGNHGSWKCCSVVEHLPSMPKTLGSTHGIPRNTDTAGLLCMMHHQYYTSGGTEC